MKRLKSPQIILTLLFLITGVSFLLFTDFGKPHYRIVDEILDYGHIPLFGIVSLVILWILNHGKWPCTITKRYVQAGIIAVFLAVLTESIQILMPNRYFQFGDIVNDTIGAAAFLWLAHSFLNNLPGLIIRLSRWAVVLFIILPAIPIFLTAIDTWNMKRTFPALSSFESFLEMSRWTQKESKICRTTLHATEGKYSLEVTLLPGNYPGISMDYLANDWSGYKSMSFDVFLQGPSPLNITVRINDQAHNNEFTDRFNRRFQILPGENHISIKLDDVEKAPKGRLMIMAEITNLSIFAYKLKGLKQVYFDNFRLEK